jgi:glycosyltransferase involved in cell wall biosynthesis
VLPAKVVQRGAAARGKLAFSLEAVRRAAGGGFGLIVCGHIHLLPVALLCRRLTRVPVVLVLHGVEVWQAPRRALPGLAKRVDLAISVSELTRRRFLEWSGAAAERVVVLPNCVDLGLYGAGPAPHGLAERYRLANRRVLLTVARLAGRERHKGIDEVLELLPALRRRHPELAYLVVGEGPDRARLETKARQLGLADAVVFAGYVPEAEKADHYRLADGFVLAGRCEGFGIVLLEAMACGLPVVASKLDGSREALRGGALGILVDPGDPADLEAGLLRALERPAGVVPEGLDYFSAERFDARCHALLDRLAAKPS